ncbi:MAG TPA: lipid-A-disaccharide synthase [Thermoanaerobaculia bacterium]|nr:lipid-A-disaccharide synthase [Thermoanaerobaculia bacterium]
MKLAIVAGEASGDLHASEVLHELRQLDPALTAFGIGGDLLAAEGMTLLHHAREMGIVGLFNVIRHLGMFRRILRELIDRIAAERPDAVLLVDYPEFNMRVARACRELGIRVIYYISPQIWAWRQGRVKLIAKLVDHMIVIFPFEEDFYRKHGVPVTYVGHPLVEQLDHVKRRANGAGETTVRLALMPGSRRMEIASLLPPMLDTVAILRREIDIDAYVIQAPTISSAELEAIMSVHGGAVPIVAHDGGQALADADVSLSSSGTATLESAIVGTPVVVMYKLSRANYLLGKLLVKVPYFSLVNIVAGDRVVPELLQREVEGKRIAVEVRKLLDPKHRATVTAALDGVRRKLGERGASRRAAQAIMDVIHR